MHMLKLTLASLHARCRYCTSYILPLLILGMMACSSSPAGADEPILPDTDDTTDNQQPSNDIHTAPSALPGQPVGFATLTAAPTGGEGGAQVTVTTAAELTAALKRSEPLIIYVKGELSFTNVLSIKAVNKTLLGLTGSKLVSQQRDASTSCILYFKEGSTNLILRNLTFESAGASDLITVSYCRFRYLKAPLAGGSGGSDDHRFCNLWGSSDSNTQDRGHLRTTFVGCWWDEGCRDRMPRVRFGQVHIVECLYSSSATSVCVGLGYEANVCVERTVFRNISKSIYKQHVKDADHQGLIELRDCLFPGSTTATSNGTSFTPPYTLSTPTAASEVEAKVRAEAGATLNIK